MSSSLAGHPTPKDDADADSSGVLLRMDGIRKRFDEVVALDDADLTVASSQVHGLLGGNGAGKTTLMNVLYGLYRADAGTIQIDGDAVDIASPREALRLGVGMVHQHFLQIDQYSVTENVALGTPLRTFPRLDLAPSRQRIGELSERFGLSVDPTAIVADLPVGVRQRVEILKALYRGVTLLILDEPTTNLTPQEVDSLFGSLRRMVADGLSVIFITHKIREALTVCDQLTVMRDGRRALTVDQTGTDADQLARAMVGEQHGEPLTSATTKTVVGATDAPPAEGPRRDDAVTVLVVERLSVRGDHDRSAVDACTFSVAAGEVLGIAGVAGNGQAELAEALAGVRPTAGGEVTLDGATLPRDDPAGRLDAGLVYIPENRRRDGILPAATLADNFLLGAQRAQRFLRGRFLDRDAVHRRTVAAMRDYRIQAPGLRTRAGVLSGGNIQRLVLARAFSHAPKVLVAHNPTRGLDIASMEFVYRQLHDAAARGAAVVLISEDLDEILRLGQRVAVMFDGRIAAILPREECDPYRLGRLMAGVDGAA